MAKKKKKVVKAKKKAVKRAVKKKPLKAKPKMKAKGKSSDTIMELAREAPEEPVCGPPEEDDESM